MRAYVCACVCARACVCVFGYVCVCVRARVCMYFDDGYVDCDQRSKDKMPLVSWCSKPVSSEKGEGRQCVIEGVWGEG